jgi:hypothetical protein
MFLKKSETDDLIKISEFEDLIDPFQDSVSGKLQGGENEQPPESFSKKDLVFPSGENLPLCWLDGNYKSK